MKKMINELRNIISNDCDFTLDINPVDFRINISREMWEENTFSVVYSGMSESPYLDVDDLQYDLNLYMIKNILNVMNWINENLEEINQCIHSCGKAV